LKDTANINLNQSSKPTRGKSASLPNGQSFPFSTCVGTNLGLSAAVGLLLILMLPLERAGAQKPAAVRLPQFIDIRQAAKINFRHHGSPTDQKYLVETMGGGVAVTDFNQDGLLDIFFVNGGRLTNSMRSGSPIERTHPEYSNHLYLSKGDGTYDEVSEPAGVTGRGYGMGAAVGDYDNDGFPDLYVTNFGSNTLYHNNGNGTFADATKAAGVAAGGWSASAGFFDYDNDGYLDLFVTRYLIWDFDKNPFCGDPRSGFRGYCHPHEFEPTENILYRNNGNGTFSDVSASAGISTHRGMSLGVAFNDYDGDGRTDIFVSNDAMEQYLLHNEGDGTFSEQALEAGAAFNADGGYFAGMGVDFNDYDNDGRPDVIITDLSNERYSLYHNDGSDLFSYATTQTGIGRISLYLSGWGVHFMDYDNDGWKDLFVAQAHVMDNIEQMQSNLRYRLPLLLLKNTGKKFEDVSAQSGPTFKIPFAGRGAAFGDLDNDGNTDVVVCVLNDLPLILHNDGGSSGNHWLLVDTVGTKSNRDGLGARIKVVGESGSTQYGYASTAGSYQSASDKRVHFGLASDKVVRLLEVHWPSGAIQKLTDVKADQVLKVTEPVSPEGGK
jgi:enediyne biosynthesis protein E4